MKTIHRILLIVGRIHFAWAYFLPPFLSLSVLVLAWKEWDVRHNGAKALPPMAEHLQCIVFILFIYCMLAVYVTSIPNRFYRELVYLPIYLFSVYVAFRGGVIYGTGLACVLTFLLVPYYCVLLYHLRIMIKELPARKLLLGKEGTICWIGQFHTSHTVNIAGQEYQVSPRPSHGFNIGDIVIVTSVKLNDIIVELKEG